jgi:hypothetical protein
MWRAALRQLKAASRIARNSRVSNNVRTSDLSRERLLSVQTIHLFKDLQLAINPEDDREYLNHVLGSPRFLAPVLKLDKLINYLTKRSLEIVHQVRA